jgi:hypothetical protein
MGDLEDLASVVESRQQGPGPSSNENCANCGKSIGRLETAHLYNSHVVCQNCLQYLSQQNSLGTSDLVPQTIDYRRAMQLAAQSNYPITIEQTSKVWKLWQALSGLGIFVGIVVLIFGNPGDDKNRNLYLIGIGLIICVLSFLSLTVASTLAWWDNG